MASELSYKIALKNVDTEKEGIKYVLQNDQRLYGVSKESRKLLLKLLELPDSYRRSFDLLMLPSHNESLSHTTSEKDVVLIELKTTKKYLPNNPKGFFFGATENEFNLARKLGNQYLFCFVCLHPESKSFAYLALNEVKDLIKTKRTQFQINLRKD